MAMLLRFSPDSELTRSESRASSGSLHKIKNSEPSNAEQSSDLKPKAWNCSLALSIYIIVLSFQ